MAKEIMDACPSTSGEGVDAAHRLGTAAGLQGTTAKPRGGSSGARGEAGGCANTQPASDHSRTCVGGMTMAERILGQPLGAPKSPGRRTAADIREGLAPMKKGAQLQLLDGSPLSGWLTSPEAFDRAVEAALASHSRDEIVIYFEEAL